MRLQAITCVHVPSKINLKSLLWMRRIHRLVLHSVWLRQCCLSNRQSGSRREHADASLTTMSEMSAGIGSCPRFMRFAKNDIILLLHCRPMPKVKT
jgi:hypothetical protein